MSFRFDRTEAFENAPDSSPDEFAAANRKTADKKTHRPINKRELSIADRAARMIFIVEFLMGG